LSINAIPSVNPLSAIMFVRGELRGRTTGACWLQQLPEKYPAPETRVRKQYCSENSDQATLSSALSDIFLTGNGSRRGFVRIAAVTAGVQNVIDGRPDAVQSVAAAALRQHRAGLSICHDERHFQQQRNFSGGASIVWCLSLHHGIDRVMPAPLNQETDQQKCASSIWCYLPIGSAHVLAWRPGSLASLWTATKPAWCCQGLSWARESGSATRIRATAVSESAGRAGQVSVRQQWPGVRQFWQWDGRSGRPGVRPLHRRAGREIGFESLLFTACLDFRDNCPPDKLPRRDHLPAGRFARGNLPAELFLAEMCPQCILPVSELPVEICRREPPEFACLARFARSAIFRRVNFAASECARRVFFFSLSDARFARNAFFLQRNLGDAADFVCIAFPMLSYVLISNKEIYHDDQNGKLGGKKLGGQLARGQIALRANLGGNFSGGQISTGNSLTGQNALRANLRRKSSAGKFSTGQISCGQISAGNSSTAFLVLQKKIIKGVAVLWAWEASLAASSPGEAGSSRSFRDVSLLASRPLRPAPRGAAAVLTGRLSCPWACCWGAWPMRQLLWLLRLTAPRRDARACQCRRYCARRSPTAGRLEAPRGIDGGVRRRSRKLLVLLVLLMVQPATASELLAAAKSAALSAAAGWQAVETTDRQRAESADGFDGRRRCEDSDGESRRPVRWRRSGGGGVSSGIFGPTPWLPSVVLLCCRRWPLSSSSSRWSRWLARWPTEYTKSRSRASAASAEGRRCRLRERRLTGHRRRPSPKRTVERSQEAVGPAKAFRRLLARQVHAVRAGTTRVVSGSTRKGVKRFAVTRRFSFASLVVVRRVGKQESSPAFVQAEAAGAALLERLLAAACQRTRLRRTSGR
uniref:Protein kinase domain-containing protein n=1 Tax=Macrostomum lignano TaxID=282301 RepID=A0A1I8F736_9PLAT